MHVWIHYFALPFDPRRYPVVVLTYRCRNILYADTYGMWFDDTTGPNFGGLYSIKSSDLISDGKAHELRVDVRQYKPKGPIIGAALGVMSGRAAPAEFELIGWRFEAPPDAPQRREIPQDTPISVHVVDSAGRPVEGAAVTVDAERVNWARTAVTDTDGRATLVPLANGSGRHMLRVAMAGFVPVEAGDRHGRWPLPERITLTRGARYGGTVLDAQGRGIQGASVNISVPAGTDARIRRRRSFHVLTDGQGRWRTPMLPADLGRLPVHVAHRDYLSDPPRGSHWAPPMEQLRNATAIAVLRRGVRVTGVVVGAQGNPIGSAYVRLGADDWDHRAPHAWTDDDGRFDIAHAMKGESLLMVDRVGLAPKLIRLTVTAEMEPVRIQLDEGRTLDGRVVDVHGEPLAAVELWMQVDSQPSSSWIENGAITDARGRFTLKNVPAAPVVLRAWKKGYMKAREIRLPRSQSESVIALLAPLRIRGRVVDARTGQPIRRFQVIAGAGDSPGDRVAWQRGRADRHFTEGRYELHSEQPWPTRMVRVEADGYTPAVSRQIARDEGDVTVDFSLEPGADVAGVVVDARGRPAGGVKVILCTPREKAHIRNGSDLSLVQGPVATTDLDGRFSFPPQVEPCRVVALHADGYAECSAEQLADRRRLRLRPWGRLEGQLMIGARPGVGERIRVWTSPAQELDEPQVVHEIESITDRAGRFAVTTVPPGSVEVCRHVRVAPGRWSAQQSRSIDVAPGKVSLVQLGGQGRPVIGQVVWPAGSKGINFANLRASFHAKADPQLEPKSSGRPDRSAAPPGTPPGPPGHFDLPIDADGRFRVEDVPAGTYALRVWIRRPPGATGPDPTRPSLGGLHEFTVPPVPGGRSDLPLDLGALRVEFEDRRKNDVEPQRTLAISSSTRRP